MGDLALDSVFYFPPHELLASPSHNIALLYRTSCDYYHGRCYNLLFTIRRLCTPSPIIQAAMPDSKQSADAIQEISGWKAAGCWPPFLYSVSYPIPPEDLQS